VGVVVARVLVSASSVVEEVVKAVGRWISIVYRKLTRGVLRGKAYWCC
jgi:hypothetical protein